MRLALALGPALVLAAASGPIASSSRGSPCIRYETDTVSLTGRLRRETYPGPPNYESIQDNDEPEVGFYLRLPHSICTQGDSGEGYPAIAALQLVLDSAGYARLRSSVGGTATVRGTLFPAETGHHHTKVLMQVIWDR